MLKTAAPLAIAAVRYLGAMKARHWKPSSAASVPRRLPVARFGRIDAAVNAAGTEGRPGPVTEQTGESYAATFDTNVLGTLLSMKHELRVMRAQGRGSIINISSTYGHEGAAGASVYAASKHAVEGLTKSAALEGAGSGVRVNAVAPGPTDTGMLTRFTGTPEKKAALVTTVPMARLGLSEELANAIVFIASDEASCPQCRWRQVPLILSGRGGLLRARLRGGLPEAPFSQLSLRPDAARFRPLRMSA
jgi:NAD(P)-dependent dehydrogenase (short-subunit alcohol dehydrogenase family)